jgi:hypothetical protein
MFKFTHRVGYGNYTSRYKVVRIQWWLKQNASHFIRRPNKHGTSFCACQTVTGHNTNTEIMSSLYIYACEQLRAVTSEQPTVHGNVECRSVWFCFVYSQHTGRTHTELYRTEYSCDSIHPVSTASLCELPQKFSELNTSYFGPT